MEESIWLVFAFADCLCGHDGAVLLQSGGEDCTQRDTAQLALSCYLGYHKQHELHQDGAEIHRNLW